MIKSFSYKWWNNLVGWLVFLIALGTYSLTVEPTASFWDCGEYIATSVKLEVGHPPGAPFFQILGAFFAIFSTSPQKIALTVNMMSVFSSAFTVLFMFWCLTNLLGKLVKNAENELSKAQKQMILGSGAIGALAFAFSDSFWFNAVEAEVYAMATLFMSMMLWLTLRWIDDLHKPRGNRWLLLICLTIGLSFGVHFMALLTIPTIGMAYYFKTVPAVSTRGFITANAVSIAVLLFIFKLLLPYTLAFFGYSEVFFVNSVGLPFNGGTIIAALLLIAAFYGLLTYTHKKSYPYLNTITLCVLFIFIGFSMWLMLPIRANADTIINENSPSDARSLLAYYNLEQYPETHLFYGPMYTDAYAGQDEDHPYEDEKPKYERNKKTGKYDIVNQWENAKIAPNSKHEGFLPRLWSTENAENYIRLAGPVDFYVNPEYQDNKELGELVKKYKSDIENGSIRPDEIVSFFNKFKEYLIIEKPGFWQNIYYMFKFQIDYMYVRYFMWNFVGRQDDVQGNLDDHGNWLSGIKFIDEAHLGSQDNLPSDVLNNKARNVYFFLPLALGIVGLVFQFKRDKRQFWLLFLLFLFTGLALKFYLNERSFEPRERDYALVGSFYVFAIWIGFGAYALFDKLKSLKQVPRKILAPAITIICLLLVPSVMAYQNWDDHDRSDRYTAQTMAKAYLDSIDKDKGAMLFTIGDNDTFALWYAQEIEGYRTDVRTINTSLLATDWYIDQMKRKAYESDPIPASLTHDKYKYGTRDAIYYQKGTDARWDIKDFIKWISTDDTRTQITFQSGQKAIFYPTYKIRLPVNKKNALESGLVKAKDSARIVDYIDINLPKTILTKNRLIMLDILANNDWKRPIYFTGGSFDSAEYIWMKDYLQLDGLVYKLVPIRTPVDKNDPYNMGRIDSDLMYDIISKWDWGNAESKTIYYDPETRKNSISYRGNISKLVDTLVAENKIDKAKSAIDIVMTNQPFGYFGYYTTLNGFIKNYYAVGEPEKARNLFLKLAKKYQEYLEYYSKLGLDAQYSYGSKIITNMERYRELLEDIRKDPEEGFFDKQIDVFNGYIDTFTSFYDKSERFYKDGLPDDEKDAIDSLLESKGDDQSN